MEKRTEILKNLIKRVIDAQYQHIQEMNFNDMNDEEAAEYEEANKSYSELHKKIFEIIPKEYHKLINQYCEAEMTVLCIEESYMFNRGVKSGLCDLSYIREELGQSIITVL